MGNVAHPDGRRFAIAGFVAAVVASAVNFSLVWAWQPASNGPREWTTGGVVLTGLVFVVPVLLALAGCVTKGRAAVPARWASAALFLLAVAFFGVGFALFLVPAVLLALSAVYGHRTSRAAHHGPQNEGARAS